MHDLVIRNGTIVDGTGAPALQADLAVDGGRIAAIAPRLSSGRHEIDATGRIVTPGWIDIHTHYDGQATWDPYLTPSGGHGVTTLVMGNCGVGFAPVRPGGEEQLIGVMEGVEDIPGSALAEGIKWAWEDFPAYLDALAAMPRALDIAAQIPHSALRLYVMGGRAAEDAATPDDIAQMSTLVEQAMRAGAVGFSTSRTVLHRTSADGVLPGTNAALDEMRALGRAVGATGHGVFQMISDFADPDAEFAWMARLSREASLPVHYSLVQHHKYPEKWRHLLALTDAAVTNGADIHPLVATRPIGMLICLDSKTHPFSAHPSYRAIAHLPLEARAAIMRDANFRCHLLAEKTTNTSRILKPLIEAFGGMYRLGDLPAYEPSADRSIAAIAARKGKTPAETAYNMLLEDNGSAMLYFPYFNYAEANFDALEAMIKHPRSLLSLGDGGAHCGLICDAGMPTYLLTRWVRDRKRLTLEQAVHMQTARNADAYGFKDRGRLQVGQKADINVIDLDRLDLNPPRWAADLPANGKRLLQDATGYDATIVAGQVTWRDGKPTGTMPGKLVRGA